MKNKRFNMLFDPALLSALRSRAIAESRTVSGLIKYIITKYLEETK